MATQVQAVLRRFASRITAETSLEAALRRLGKTERDLEREGMTETLAMTIVRTLTIYLATPLQRLRCREELMALATRGVARAGTVARAGSRNAPAAPVYATTTAPIRLTIAGEDDLVRARRDARTLAADLGLDHSSSIKVATAVSELVRNILAYAGTGTVELGRAAGRRVGIRVVAEDQGPGIQHLEEILDGGYRSKTGMGLGLLGTRRIMDSFEIKSTPGKGTRVEIVKYRY